MPRSIVLRNAQYTALGIALHFIKGVRIFFDEKDVKYNGVILAMERYAMETPITHYFILLRIEHCPKPVRFLVPVRPSTNVISSRDNQE